MECLHLRSERRREAAEGRAGIFAVHLGFSASGNWHDFHGAGARRHDCARGNAAVALAVAGGQEPTPCSPTSKHGAKLSSKSRKREDHPEAQVSAYGTRSPWSWRRKSRRTESTRRLTDPRGMATPCVRK